MFAAMEWWSLFRTVRRVGLAVVSVVSILWAILLSVYAAREWNDAVHSQRIIVLVMIGLYVYTCVMVYLMIVVIFKLWADFRRALILVVLHLGIAMPLTIFVPTFNCAVFISEGTCKSTQIFALFITWSIVAFFVLHAVFICIMSRFPQPLPDPTTEEPVSPMEKAEFDLEADAELKAEQKVEPTSPNTAVSQATRVQAFPARLVMMDGSAPPASPSRTPWQFTRTPTALSTSSTIDDMPTLPYGASSVEGFFKSPSPAPSYTSQESVPPRRQYPARRERSMLLSRYVLDRVARNGSPDSESSVSTVESRTRGFSDKLDGRQLARPPRVMVADHGRASSIYSETVPAQLRPGTPASLQRSDSGSSTSSEGASLSVFTAHVESHTRVGTPTSIRSFAPSLLFVDEARTGTPVPVSAVTPADPSKRLGASALSRQPTLALKLPNPHDSVLGEAE